MKTVDDKTESVITELEALKDAARLFRDCELAESDGMPAMSRALRQLCECAISFAEVTKARHRTKNSVLERWRAEEPKK